jgi:hypothetical protein
MSRLGGAQLTATGEQVLRIYRAIERECQRDVFAVALALWLLGYSLVDMSVCMYDALEPQLTLLDGMTGRESGGHDWINLFDRLGLLHPAQHIGEFWVATDASPVEPGVRTRATRLTCSREHAVECHASPQSPGPRT